MAGRYRRQKVVDRPGRYEFLYTQLIITYISEKKEESAVQSQPAPRRYVREHGSNPVVRSKTLYKEVNDHHFVRVFIIIQTQTKTIDYFLLLSMRLNCTVQTHILGWLSPGTTSGSRGNAHSV